MNRYQKNNQILEKKKQQAVEFLTAAIANDRLCYSIELDDLCLGDLNALIATMELSAADIAEAISKQLYQCKDLYIGVHYSRCDEDRANEFIQHPYNSVIMSLACDNKDPGRAIAIWESINKRYLSDTEKKEIIEELTIVLSLLASDINYRCVKMKGFGE